MSSERRAYALPKRTGCFDACCGPGRNAEDFDLESGYALSDADVAELLKMSAAGVTSLVLIQLFLKLLWELATIVPGFALYDGAPSTVSAYTHAGWWMIIDTSALAFGLCATYFGLNYASEAGVVERGVERTHAWLGAYMIVLALAAVADLTHAGLALSELAVCDSTLCTQNQWNLIVLVVVLFVRPALLFWCMYRVWAFRSNLKMALAFNRMDMRMAGDEKPKPIESSITPLLRNARRSRPRTKP